MLLYSRDDPSPAPWTAEGKDIIEREGYVCIKMNPEEGKGLKRKASNEDEGEVCKIQIVLNRIRIRLQIEKHKLFLNVKSFKRFRQK